jgi:acyl-CoA dehydrogenase
MREMTRAAASTLDWVGVADALGRRFAERAAVHDAEDRFVQQNYDDLEAHRVFGAGVPAELGGGGASQAELAEMLTTFARFCGSTALALAMHTHLVAAAAWRWRRQQRADEGLLRQVAEDQVVLVTSGGADWLAGSGRAEPAEGGFRVSGRKVFVSGAPAGRLLLTTAVLDGPGGEPTVLHLGVPADSPGVRVLDTWYALGMRGTGSHEVALEGVFVPAAAVAVQRPAGRWSPPMHLVTMVALPLIYAVYVGIAEAARDLAVASAARRRRDPDLAILVGEMENALTAARLAQASMVEIAAAADPSPETTSAVSVRRTLVAQGAIRTVEKAMEVAGGSAFLRDTGLERLYRDVQAARYHPLQTMPQLRLTGRLALGLDVDG